MKYQSSFKLKVVQFANSTNNCAAYRKFDVNEKLIRGWKKCEDSLKSMPSKRCAMRRGISYWPELENNLYEWAISSRQNGYVITRNTIKIQALRWSRYNVVSQILWMELKTVYSGKAQVIRMNMKMIGILMRRN